MRSRGGHGVWAGIREVFDLYELNLSVDTHHPLVAFTRAHPTVHARICVKADAMGRRFVTVVLRASRALQEEYRRVQSRGEEGCGDLQPVYVRGDVTIYVSAPCQCGNAAPGCRELQRVQNELANVGPAAVVLHEVEFARGRCSGRATYHGPTPPQFQVHGTPLRTVGVRRQDAAEFAAELLVEPLRPIETETLREAVRLGYYDTPRRCTMEDLALVLGITKSAVCHRLRQIEEKAIRRVGFASASAATAPAALAVRRSLPLPARRPLAVNRPTPYPVPAVP